MIDGFELETIADEFEEISGEGFPKEDYSRFTLGELLKSFRKKKIKR